MLAPLMTAVLLANLPPGEKAGENALTTLRLSPTTHGLNLRWNDTEDLLQGTIVPARPKAGEPVTFTLHLDPYGGEPFTGPLTVSLRPLAGAGAGAGAGDAQSATIPRLPEERAWRVTFTPPREGPHRLEVSWRSTRHKAVRGDVLVGEARVPSWFLAVVGGGLILMASGGGAWFLLRRQEKAT
jgi:hypothetical protein